MKRYIPLKRIFYVYVLFRPWNGIPFYVGKGQGSRWEDHERDGMNHYNPLMRRILKKAVLLNLEIPKVKVREGLFEKEAFETEAALITAIGRGSKGPLVNLTDGGDGCSLSSEALVKRGASIKEAHQKVPPEIRSQRAKDRNAKKTAEELSASAKKAAAAQTPEQRSAKAKKAWATRSEADRKENLRLMWAAQKPEILARNLEKARAALTLEARRLNGIKGAFVTPFEARSMGGKRAQANVTVAERSRRGVLGAKTRQLNKLKNAKSKIVGSDNVQISGSRVLF